MSIATESAATVVAIPVAEASIFGHMVTTTQSCIRLLDRSIAHYCDAYLPHPINIVAEVAIKAFPIIALQLALPAPYYVASLFVIIAFSIATTHNPQEPSSLGTNLKNAIALRSLYSSGAYLGEWVQTYRAEPLLWAITHLCIGVLSSFQSNLAQRIFHLDIRPEDL